MFLLDRLLTYDLRHHMANTTNNGITGTLDFDLHYFELVAYGLPVICVVQHSLLHNTKVRVNFCKCSCSKSAQTVEVFDFRQMILVSSTTRSQAHLYTKLPLF